jgi:HPt (histidine-containing phosphotransfer) domain-containing protein
MMAEKFVLDRGVILERLGGDEEIFSMMVDMFLQDVERNCALLAEASAGGNLVALHREAHTVKSLLATFSDDAGAAEALLVEQQAKRGVAEGLAAQVDALQKRLQEVAAVLRGLP